MINENSGIRKSDVINRRMFIIGAAKIVVLAGIIARLFSLQINENKKYLTLSDKNRIREWKLPPTRGNIVDYFGNIIAGNLKASDGQVVFNNQNITNVPSYELFSKGLLRTFQIAHEFTNLTVLENLMMVPGNQSGERLMTALLKPRIVKKEEAIIRNKAYEVIEFLNLKHLANELAGNLSGGQKKLLELGRTMMVDAKIVLLDEVGAGVNRTLLKDIGTAILRLNKEKGYTFCMIEHDMDFISRMCDPVIVMAEGSVLFEGTPDEVKKNEKVIESYLGRGSNNRDGKN